MTVSGFDRLDPAIQHHVVNSLGWRALRPLQERAIDPVLDGDHALLSAPTAGGKTEAAVLPLLSRMLDEKWSGLSVLYLCPLKALLNNLTPRLSGYAELVGRRAAVWHGDVGASDRRRILADPPDLLLTTPESLEAMFLSRRVDVRVLLGFVQSVVVDEIHAFAADDRGWHLLAMLERIDALRGASAQRVGLTATVGNPDELLNWLTCREGRQTTVSIPPSGDTPAEIAIDFTGSVSNAARVIAGLHTGEKRLVFADSRARVEELAVALRAEGVETFVSHSSLSADERRQAERAFYDARDCVIVATSTLELGIDVGDLDRVIQIGAPRTVASLLQRMGRTGRRAGTVRNYLFLATSEMELLQALALERLHTAGWVEPLTPADWPAHLVAQQLLARVLAGGRLGPSEWPGPLSALLDLAGLDAEVADSVVAHCLDHELLIESDSGWQVGPAGEREFGQRHFMELTSLFLTNPLLSVRWGQRMIGHADPSSLSTRDGQRATILLGGRAWGVREVDWQRRVVWVEPVDEPGRARWAGPGGALSIEVCRAMRAVLVDDTSPGGLSQRGHALLGELRARFWWAENAATTVVPDLERQRTTWWTFAGGRANQALEFHLRARNFTPINTDELSLTLAGTVTAIELREVVQNLDAGQRAPVDKRRLDDLKFATALPEAVALEVISRRDQDQPGLASVRAEPMTSAAYQ